MAESGCARERGPPPPQSPARRWANSSNDLHRSSREEEEEEEEEQQQQQSLLAADVRLPAGYLNSQTGIQFTNDYQFILDPVKNSTKTFSTANR